MAQETAGPVRWWPHWVRRPTLSAAALGRFQIVALLPRVNAPLAVLVGALALVGPALALAFTLTPGALVGAAPAAVAGGFTSPAGHRTLLALAAAAAVFVAQRVLGPLRGTLATVLGDQLDRHLEARLLRAATRPPGVAHLENPTVLDKLAQAQGLGAVHYRPAGALAGLDLCIPAGRSLAIVGANGAGKTTLIKLLCRLYDPTAGAITVDGVDVRAFDAAAWQRRVAAIFQDFVQYPLPARDNVAFGAVERQGDLVGLRTAAKKADALEVIETLPQGWDTILSRQFTGGAELSGGQWQRIALARALFAAAAGAGVLILDEPTASLDVRAEAELYERFLEITAGLTTILISHRFSTVRRADRIVVLESGHVVEEGTHDALLALGGRYAELFTLQASRFVDDGDEGAGGAGQTGRKAPSEPAPSP